MRTTIATRAPETESARPRTAAAGQRTLPSLVIVGNGMVGHRLCRRLVALGATSRWQMTVFGEEPLPAYDRVHLTDALSGHHESDLVLAPREWYADHGIDLRLGDPVIDIDRDARIVRSATGYELEYSQLALATGSSAFVPPIEGTDRPGVFVYRSLGDLQAIRRHARLARTGAVIGGGLLGLEAARALQGHGLAITVVEMGGNLMPAQLDQRAGQELETRIAALGIAVRTGTRTTRIGARDGRPMLEFVGGGTLCADIVVIAAGVRPRSQLAARCGLARCAGHGIVVDDYLRTSDPFICAVGECASHRAHTYGLVAPGYEMADALALNLTGTRTAFRGVTPATRLKLLGVEVVSAGEPLERGLEVRFRDDTSYRLLRIERNRLTGALGVGEWPEFSRVQDAIGRRRRIWPWQAARFGRTGSLWRTPRVLPVAEWPAQAVVCNCLNVTRGQLAAARRQGAVSLETLVESTGASSVCGTCRPLVAELAVEGARARPRVSSGLLAASAAALAVALAVIAAPAIPFAASIQEASRLELLWRDGTARQVSGFVVLALSLAASLLPLRKRWRRAASFGTYGGWRTAHAVVGVLTLATLAVHTGGRLGDNFNSVLMTSFATLNVLGAGAGAVTGAAPWLATPPGRRWRARLVAAHLLATWPLPALIAFHVLAVYYF